MNETNAFRLKRTESLLVSHKTNSVPVTGNVLLYRMFFCTTTAATIVVIIIIIITITIIVMIMIIIICISLVSFVARLLCDTLLHRRSRGKRSLAFYILTERVRAARLPRVRIHPVRYAGGSEKRSLNP